MSRFAIFLTLMLPISPAAFAATVTFTNPGTTNLELHVRVGPVDQHPDDRGSTNSTMRPGDNWELNVGDGDVWFAYGNQAINYGENPELCNAAGGETIALDRQQVCYVDN